MNWQCGVPARQASNQVTPAFTCMASDTIRGRITPDAATSHGGLGESHVYDIGEDYSSASGRCDAVLSNYSVDASHTASRQ